jgi:hypothetical protein
MHEHDFMSLAEVPVLKKQTAEHGYALSHA